MSHLMSNEKVLKAAGVTDEEITTINTADANVIVNTLEPIFNKLMSYVQTQRVEVARLDNPLRGLEKGYAAMNGGSLNGMFQEVLVQARDKGADNLYGGKKYAPKTITNPYVTFDYGKDPLSFIYKINAKMERMIDYDAADMLMALKNNSLDDFIMGKLAVLQSENNAAEYVMENNVLNCEEYQYDTYANVQKFSDAASLNAFMHKVFAMQRYPESNMQYKKVKFNTTRGTGDFVLIIDTQFAFDFAQKFTYKQYLKPFLFRSEDRDNYGMQEERSRIIEVDALNPTMLAANTNLDPMNMTKATITGGKLIGRIVDFNAVKFGLGFKSAISKPLNARTTYYNEIQDYCFDMCPAYVNVPLVITDDFKSDRIISVSNVAAGA